MRSLKSGNQILKNTLSFLKIDGSYNVLTSVLMLQLTNPITFS